MNKIDERRHKILEILSTNPTITQNQLCEILNVSLRTIKGDFTYFRNQGYPLNNLEGRKIIPELQNKPMFSCTEDAITALLVLYNLSAKGIPIDEMCDSYDFPVSRSTLYRRILPYLSDNQLLKKIERRYEAEKIYFTTLPDSDKDILNFSIHCLSTKSLLGKQIYDKASNYLSKKNLVMVSKKEPAYCKLPYYTSILKKCNTEKNPLSFIYRGKVINFFYLGFIAYSSDKDAVYLIGRSKPTKLEYRVFRADSIDWTSIKKTDDYNFRKALNDKNFINSMKCYYKRIRAEMFEISEDKLEHVEIRLNFSYNNLLSISQLYKYRKSQWDDYDMFLTSINTDKQNHPMPKMSYWDSSGTPCDVHNKNVKYIIYSDYIRGLSNFANYLRRFGDEATVTINEHLKKTIIAGAKRSLSHYNKS